MSQISSGLSGFYNTPISKALVLGVGGMTIATSILRWKPYLNLILNPHLTRDNQFWRLITSQLAFANSGELLFGCILLYQFRVIERFFGPAKFSAFVFLSSIGTKLLELGCLVSSNSLGLNILPAGPYGIIFAMLFQYYKQIPTTYKFRVLGLTFSDKSYVYFLALQYPQSFVPAICGILTGLLYHTDVGGIKKFRFPGFITRFAKSWLLPLLASTSARSSAATMEQVYGSDIRNLNTSLSNLLSQPGQASSMGRSYVETMTQGIPQTMREEEIMALMTMFPDTERQIVVAALQSANNDVNTAATILLSR
ncbi:hypothetical protein H4R33_001231 [Dimargaris cristalligena]|uniref:CUE domain-containing protein n=1 Tax=Dimargaris cristalligena TaxID=215637 RepID=A0A4V1J5C1_9FUNG|nr:hypothetical protein H4R33_001231 [Dimargaris cristalligena]RKP38539.1 hypothetical protein BJ085DRAFT_35129 [Dimargaris cristalligena]|eukprot:RKP38539.1 hypothetical protein BJ085DRAFT_35129 [Dimargaris cristalligena]